MACPLHPYAHLPWSSNIQSQPCISRRGMTCCLALLLASAGGAREDPASCYMWKTAGHLPLKCLVLCELVHTSGVQVDHSWEGPLRMLGPDDAQRNPCLRGVAILCSVLELLHMEICTAT